VTSHARTEQIGAYPADGTPPAALTTKVYRDGTSPAESAAAWTSAYQRAGDGSYLVTQTSPMGRSTWAKFAPNHQMVESGGTGHATSYYGYGALGLPAAVTVVAADGSAATRTSHWLWSSGQLAGQSGETSDAKVSYARDAAGRVTETRFADQSTAHTPRDLAGQVTAVAPAAFDPPTGANGQPPPTYSFDHGPKGRLASETLPAAPPWLTWQTSYVYDADQAVTKRTRPDGKAFTFGYESASGLLTQVVAPNDAQDGVMTWTIGYEPGGARRPTALQNDIAKLSYTYQGALPKAETWSALSMAGAAALGGSNGASVVRSWDKRLRPILTQVGLPNAAVAVKTTAVTAGFDADDLPVAMTLTDANATALVDLQLQRDAATGRLMALTATSNPGNPATAKSLRVDYAYNGFGEISSQQVAGPQGLLYREGYLQRDQLGRLTKRVVGTDPATAVTHGYGYHPQRGWLTQHKLNDSLADAWSYDVRGNRVGKHTGLAGEVTAIIDAQDRLVQLGAEALAYDLNGRVVARSGGQLPATYVWDAFGRLREARLNPSQPTEIAVAYGLDPAGRRVRAVAKDASGAVLEDRSWVYDGQLRVIAEVSASGALRARYLYASSGHSPDAAVTFDPDSGVVTGSYLLVHDQVGSVVRTVDLATGVAVESVAYDPWGVATVTPVGTAVHPFGFAGGLWDRRTGLVRFGAREYDAGLGRWLARDPIGFGGGWNQYGYVGNLPTLLVDPDGLKVMKCRGPVEGPVGALGCLLDDRTCYHEWLCTDSKCGGVDSAWYYRIMPMNKVLDEKYTPRDDCVVVPADEECVNNEIVYGSLHGPYMPLVNDCQSWTSSVLAKCTPFGPFDLIKEILDSIANPARGIFGRRS
jgi:RHS repeat-associated protein